MKDHLFLFYFSFFLSCHAALPLCCLIWCVSASSTSAQHGVQINHQKFKLEHAFLVFCQRTPVEANWVTLVLWNIVILDHLLFGRSAVKSCHRQWSCQQSGLWSQPYQARNCGNTAKPHCNAAWLKKKWFSQIQGQGGGEIRHTHPPK